MLKKKLVTIVAAAFCVALVTAQQSGVNKVTTGLIEDGAIDSIKFGTEDGSGVVFGQYDNTGNVITLGWGNSLSDTLWLSVVDAWIYKTSNAVDKATANNDANGTNAIPGISTTPDDGINVDYTKTTRKVEGSNSTHIANLLGVGLGINNTLGFQLAWGADYLVYKNPAAGADTPNWGENAISDDTAGRVIKEEVNNPGTGVNTKKEWTKFANNNIDNNFTVNFKGVGIEDVGDIAFFVKLNKVYFNWNSINRTGDYTESSSTNGKTTSETTITGKNTENTLTPGLNFDLGLNIIDNDVATVKFVYEDEFSMTFKPRTNESTKTSKDYIASATTETTTTDSYKVEYGKYLKWSNKFEPKLAAEFNVAEPLKLKAQLALPVSIGSEIDEAGKYEKTSQTDTFNRTYGYTTYNKTTTTGNQGTRKISNAPDGTDRTTSQNLNEFKTVFAPKLSAGFVYEVTPGKFNVSFGASAQPTYTWTTTTLTNANINKIVKSETKSIAGNVTSEVVTGTNQSQFGVDDGVSETKTTTVRTDIDTAVNLGATWFFTENVNFDVYFLNAFGNDFFSTSKAGASVTVKF